MIPEASFIQNILEHRVPWLIPSQEDQDIAISSRIRLARNLKNYAFPCAASNETRQQVIDDVYDATAQIPELKDAFRFRMESLNEHEKLVLVERSLMSPMLLGSDAPSAVLVTPSEQTSVMVNEEDHLRMQTLLHGFDLHTCWDSILTIERKFDELLELAYTEPFGYLTSCPTNVGTGMRVSVMLHLPALVITDQITTIIRSAAPLGLTIRGIMGEGSENIGNLFQISNQSTLGDSEIQVIERIETVIKQVMDHEKNMREKLMTQRYPQLMNHVGRAYGVMKHAYIINTKEAINALSAIRLGADLNLIPKLSLDTINQLFLLMLPGHLSWLSQRELQVEERDIFRAEFIRKKLNDFES